MILNRIDSAGIYLFWIACVLNPTPAEYKFKIFALGFMLLWIILRLFLSNGLVKITYEYIIIFFFFLAIPAYGLLISSLYGGLYGPFIDTSYLTSSLYLMASAIYLFSTNKVVAIRAMIFSLRIIVILILYSFLMQIVGHDSNVVRFFLKSGALYIGMRNYGGIDFYYIYYIVSPMLVILISYETYKYSNNRNLLRFLLLVFAVISLFLTGTRTNMLLSVCTPFLIIAWFYIGRFSYLLFLGFFLFFVVLIFALKIPVLHEMFSVSESSNSIKLAYLPCYIDILSDIHVFLFGQGYNAHTWSLPVHEMLTGAASKTELTYLEFLRVHGALFLIFFLLCLGCLVLSNRIRLSASPWLSPALFIYLLLSATNPYLFSSNGMLIIGVILALLASKPKFNKYLIKMF
jgi:hypothetical protein